jgi:beta-glucanase (GH16 family)
MTRTLAVTAIISVAFLSIPAPTAAAGWQFSWSDEFNGPAVDSTVWGYEIGYVRNQELQYYSNRIENSRIDSGCLHIQALRDNWNGHAYTSASRTTRNKKSWQYGRFEIRAQIDVRQGSWPAWWAMGVSGSWPGCGEVDMMEYYQNHALTNVMNGNQVWQSIYRTVDARWAGGFHIWTMVWDSTKIDLYIDTVLQNHYSLSAADGTGPGGTNPFRQPMYMILNQAIGGTAGGDPSGTTFPVDFRVDWVRVHTWSNNAAGYTLTVNGGMGSGPYVAGTAASITAKMPAAGMVFDRWVVNAGSPIIADVLAPSATLTMPATDVTVTATYRSSTAVDGRRGLAPLYGGASESSHPRLFDLRGAVVGADAKRTAAGVCAFSRAGDGQAAGMLVAR